MTTCFRAKPLSVHDIRQIATECRKFLKLGALERINAAKLLDVLSVFWESEGFQYVVLPDDDPVFEKGVEATTDLSSGKIRIKESVMEQACRHRYKRASFTICHEIGHFILHKIMGGVSLARVSSNALKPRIFEDPEWQANTFASEFLMPVEAVRNMTPKEIRKTYCVSAECAKVRYKKIRDEFLIQDIKNHLKD